MGKIWMPGGGEGADLDVITVSDSSDVLDGKVIVDRDGNSLTGTLALSGNVSDAQVLYGQTYYNSDPKIKRTGTMPNRGAISQLLGINGTYTIPEGYHNGSGKVTQNITTMTGQIITPSALQQIVSSSGKYMTGNVVVNGDANLIANNILRGKNIFNVAGSDNVLKYLGGNTTSGTLSLSLGNGTSWYYATVNPGFTPIFALAICGSLVWRTGGNAANYESTLSGASGYYSSVSTSTWLWTSTSVRLPCASGNETCYYYIFGY